MNPPPCRSSTGFTLRNSSELPAASRQARQSRFVRSRRCDRRPRAHGYGGFLLNAVRPRLARLETKKKEQLTMTSNSLTPQTWEATPYGSHWSFAYNLPNIERDEYDFAVEFHETVAEPERLAVINLLEAAPELLAALKFSLEYLKANDDGEQDVSSRIAASEAAIAKATAA
jgi:hypothetical protein